ncbi:MAG: response regulator, partial [Candidatus Eremiobacterota bacterium]
LLAGVSTEPVAPAEVAPEVVRGLRILVVDDNATNLRVMVDLLINWGAQPVAASSGPEGLELLRAQPFDVVLTDLNMPDMDGLELAGRIRSDPALEATVVMMLASSDLKGDASRCREQGIVATMTKPVSETDLLRAIATHLRPATPRPEVVRHLPVPAMRGLSVLLAEDNKVNQTLATITLEQMGHRVAIAGDGRQAVEKVASGDFDLVLMDLQMPEMDGFQALAAIRAAGNPIPVIALTAHAMKGDRERCLEGGMTGYVPKPLDPDVLALEIATVMQGVPPREEPREATEEPAAATGADAGGAEVDTPCKEAAEVAIDEEAFLRRCAGNRQVARLLTAQYREQWPALVKEVQDALAAADPDRLGKAAHAFKGVVANFGAETLVETGRLLERLAKESDLEAARQAAAGLEPGARGLESTLARLYET